MRFGFENFGAHSRVNKNIFMQLSKDYSEVPGTNPTRFLDFKLQLCKQYF